jgi:regulator of protease activity HflC (stomatin/prohibitin superfamily)
MILARVELKEVRIVVKPFPKINYMSNRLSPLIQTLTPERWAGWSMDFIGAGYLGLLVKNGQLVRKLEPGRHFSFAVPWIEQCQIVLVDGKIRNLDVVSQGDFLSYDQYLVNVSLSIMYQVIDPKRVALELSDPIAALTSAVKDSLGVVINQLRLDQLTQEGRVQIREHLLSHLDSFYILGFNLEDVRVSDISFPQTRGVIRQVEGLSAREEAAHEATLKIQAARESTAQVHLVNLGASQPVSMPSAEATVVIRGAASLAKLPEAQDRPPLPATTLAPDPHLPITRLIHQGSGTIIPLSANPFTIGREPHNSFVSQDSMCSRNHARILQIKIGETTSYQLVDVGSSNGTFVDGQKLISHQPYSLSSGNLIKVGADQWVFEA